VGEVFYRGESHPQAPKLAPDEHGLIWLPQEAFAQAFAQHATPQELAVLAAVQRPISVACIGEAVGRPLWKDRPSWFLIAEQDRMINPETQHFMTGRMKAQVRSHQVDHTPSVTAPGAVTDIIVEAAQSVSAR
jgi:pimeloyl-ACP methyl ester carboxylesterase